MRTREGQEVSATPVDSVSSYTLQSFIHVHVKQGSTIYTDDSRAYRGLDINSRHESVNHSAGEYARANEHTNGIGSFWARLRRGYHGTYHHFSKKHMHRYINEFSTRYNREDWGSIIEIEHTIRESFLQTLGYRKLIK